MKSSIACLALCLLLSGCEWSFRPKPPAPQHEVLSFHTTPQALEVRSVAVLPFFLADGIGRTASDIDESMTSALRELGLHEVKGVSADQRGALLAKDVIQANRIGADDLLRLRDALHVDAVLIGRVEEYDSFDPISLGVTAELVSCLDGQVLWSAIGHFDGHRKDVQTEIQAWHERTAGEANSNLYGWKLVLQSPHLFTRFVAERLALSIPPPKVAAK